MSKHTSPDTILKSLEWSSEGTGADRVYLCEVPEGTLKIEKSTSTLTRTPPYLVYANCHGHERFVGSNHKLSSAKYLGAKYLHKVRN